MDINTARQYRRICDQQGSISKLVRNQLFDFVEQLHSENEALRKDAERYRWLRDPAASLDKLCADNWGPDGQVYSGDALDAAIDAARQESA